jgi:RNA recognition motif-containing protein
MKLYVGNLPFNFAADKLRETFAPIGEVISADVVSDRDTGRSRGFGFVEMSDEDGRKAIDQLNDKEVDGRRLTVNEARPRTTSGPRSSGGRPGGSSGGYGSRPSGGSGNRSTSNFNRGGNRRTGR